jgi:hypothetical protein
MDGKRQKIKTRRINLVDLMPPFTAGHREYFILKHLLEEMVNQSLMHGS